MLPFHKVILKLSVNTAVNNLGNRGRLRRAAQAQIINLLKFDCCDCFIDLWFTLTFVSTIQFPQSGSPDVKISLFKFVIVIYYIYIIKMYKWQNIAYIGIEFEFLRNSNSILHLKFWKKKRKRKTCCLALYHNYYYMPWTVLWLKLVCVAYEKSSCFF